MQVLNSSGSNTARATCSVGSADKLSDLTVEFSGQEQLAGGSGSEDKVLSKIESLKVMLLLRAWRTDGQ